MFEECIRPSCLDNWSLDTCVQRVTFDYPVITGHVAFCIFCRILERLVRGQMSSYLLRNKLPNCQHGYLAKRSTVILWNVQKSVQETPGQKTLITVCFDIIYANYSKCFDTVGHSKLVYTF